MFRRTITAALGILLSLPVSTYVVLYTCSLDGVTRSSCCCSELTRHSCCPGYEEGCGCCDVTIGSTGNDALSSAVPSASPQGAPLVVLRNLDCLAHSHGPSTSRYIVPAALRFACGPPLFVQKSAYLI